MSQSNFKAVPKAAFDQLKGDIKSLFKHDRPRKWEREILPLCKSQGFKFSASQVRQMERLVY